MENKLLTEEVVANEPVSPEMPVLKEKTEEKSILESGESDENIKRMNKARDGILIDSRAVLEEESALEKMLEGLDEDRRKFIEEHFTLDPEARQSLEKLSEAYSALARFADQHRETLTSFAERFKGSMSKVAGQLTGLVQEIIERNKELEEKLKKAGHGGKAKIARSAGKITGGISGAFAGHGIFSALGAIVGAEAGKFLALKFIEKMNMPERNTLSLRDENEQNAGSATEAEAEKEDREQKETKAVEFREKLVEKGGSLKKISGEIEELSQYRSKSFEDMGRTLSFVNKMSRTVDDLNEYFDEFEKKYPHLTKTADVSVHMTVKFLLSQLSVAEDISHAVMTVIHAGGGEKIVATGIHIANIAKKLADKLKSGENIEYDAA